VTIGENVLVQDSLRAAPAGFEVEVLLNWYRALPLSCVNTVELAVNERPIPRDHIQFVINGRERTLDELMDLWDESWFVQDHAVLRVRHDPPLRPGERATIALRLGSLIPYILNGPTSAFESVTRMSRTMTVG
jgi:Domain of unknown function (DUF6379)